MKRKPKPVLLDEEERAVLMNSLPVTISAIKVQKKDIQRASIFVDGEFLFGLPISAIESAGISRGTVLDKQLYLKLESLAIRAGIRNWLLGLLAKRAYTSSQLQRKCREAGYDSDVVSEILEEFESRKWIDDQAYAKAYVREKSELNKWGPARIRQQLIQLGIPRNDVEQALLPAREKSGQSDAIHTLVQKRKRTFQRETDLKKRKKKVVDYLLRKGYDSDVIFRHADELLKQIQE